MAKVIINNESSVLTAPIEVKIWYNTRQDDVKKEMEFKCTLPIGSSDDKRTSYTCEEITHAWVYLTSSEWKITYIFYTLNVSWVTFEEINISITDGNQYPIVKINGRSVDKREIEHNRGVGLWWCCGLADNYDTIG
jgi:hypothetical protein